MFSQLIVNSLVSGGLYATLGFGFSLILNAVKILPFFFGALGIISAYSLYWLLELGRFSFITCLLLSALVTICFTVSLNQFLFKVFRQKKASEFVMLVLGLAIGIFLENLLLMLFGPDVKTIPLPFENQNIQIFGAHVTFVQILIFAISLPLLVASVYLIYFTYLGIIVRSLIEEPQTAEILGVNKERAFFLIFLVCGLIAFLSGVLYAFEYNLEPFVGVNLTIKAFISAIIGGKDVVPASIAGGFILGTIENVSTYYLPASYKDGVSFIVMFIFLLFRPKGIFGTRLRQETAG